MPKVQTRHVAVYKGTDFLGMPSVGLRVIIYLERGFWVAYVQQADDCRRWPHVRHESHDAAVFLACAEWAGAWEER